MLFLFLFYSPFSFSRTLAVLPFENLTGDQALSVYSQGFAETLSFCFSQSPSFQVMERVQLKKLMAEKAFQEAFASGKFQDLEGVEILVLGSFQKTGKNLFITARALEIATGKALAIEAVTGRHKEIIELQKKLAQNLLRKLGDQKTKIVIPYEDKNWTDEAYRLFRQGVELYEKGLKPKARALWEKVQEKVPAVKEAVLWLYGSSQGLFQKGYSGVIIDCRHLKKLERSPFPLIFSKKGEVLYGKQVKGDPDFLLFTGLVSYPSTYEAGKRRAGPNPLLVKAVGLRKVEGVNKGVVLTDADARKVLQENRTSHFLANYRVAFLVSP